MFDNGALRDHVAERLGPRLPDTSALAYGSRTLEAPLDPAPLSRFGLAPGEYDPLVAVTSTDTANPYARSAMARAADDARFVGAIYDPEVLDPLRQHARLYLHGHIVGGTNPSPLEAMGADNVVLAHDNPFNREVLAGEEVFWREVEELVERLGDWSARPVDERVQAGESNRSRVAAVYAWDRLADDYADLIRADRDRRRAE